MVKKIMVVVLVTVFCLMAAVASPAPAAAETVADALDALVEYYEDNKPELDHWEEIVGMSRAGVIARFDLSEWQIGLGESASAVDYAAAILALDAAGEDPRVYNGRVNLVGQLVDMQQGDGSFGAINNTIYSILALDHVNADYNVDGALTNLISQQCLEGSDSGGFGYPGWGYDPDTTSMVLMAMANHRDSDGVPECVDRAVEYLKRNQSADGGFGYFGISNAASIATVIRGLVACDMDLASEHWIKGGNTIIKALYNFRLPDGSFYTGEGTNDDFSTRQALIAMTDLVDAGYGTSIVPAAISVRVEGNDKNLASKRVVHTNGSALDALEQIVQGEYAVDSHGDVTSILDEEGRSVSEEVYTGWRYYVTRNGHPDPNTFRSKPGQYNVRQGDDVTFYVGAYYENPLTQSVFEATYIPVVNITPARPVVGETLKISVSGMVYSSDTGGFLSATIDPINVNNEEILNGLAEIALSKAGTFTYQIHKQHDDGYPLLVRSNHIVIVNQPQGSGDIGGGDTISVTVLVRGKNGVVIGSFIVKLTKDDAKGLNPIYALQQTGLEVELKHNDRYVYSIDGITEDSGSTAGWKYKVNGVAPATLAAKDYRLEDGDEVEWFWALDADDIGLGAQAAPPPALNEADKQARERVTEELSKLAELLPGLTTIREELYNRVELAASNVVVITTDYSMTADDRAKWQEWLEQNRVKVSRSVDPTDNNEITDTQSNANEISLSLLGGSLDSRTSIEIYELTGSDVTIPDTHRQVSSVYDFGPDGLTFNNPVILRINIAGFEGAWENLILAWYDAANDRWVPVPSVIDSANEEISGLVNHFTKFTVLAREKQPVSFADVGNGSYDWAQKEIQYLAFKEIVSDGGAGKFEPERPVTRGEFVAMLTKAMGIEAEAVPGDKPSFTDLQPENGDYDILQAAYAAGLVRGYDDGTLRADGQITREQIAALVTRALDLEPVATEPAFADADKVSGWATESVTAAAESGLLRGFPDGSFKPDMLTDRAQGAVLIYRILSLK